MSKKFVIKPSLLSVSIAAALGSAPALLSAQAPQEEIVVTGTRIVRQDLVANSPIQTVDAELFENTSSLSVSTVLNQMPQFVPAITQFDTGNVQPSATNTTGANTISLRGLGSNRNLVLYDGRRAQPVNALLVVDTNSIPSAAIERVEVVTGGASATYGADAIAGVVNFVMKKNFEGLTIDVQTGNTEQGGGEENRMTALFGANLDGGRGNVMMGIEYADREVVYRNGHPFFDASLADPQTGATNTTFLTVPGYRPRAGNLPDINVIRDIFQGGPAPIPNNANGASALNVFFVNDTTGTLWSNALTANNIAWGAFRYADGFDTPMQGWGAEHPLRKRISNGPAGEGVVLENQPFALLSTPLTRNSIFGRGRYEVADGLEVYAQANFVKTVTRTIMTWATATTNYTAEIPFGADIYAPSVCTAVNALAGCPSVGATQASYLPGGSKGLANCGPTGGCTNSQAFPVPAELERLLLSRPNQNATWTLHGVLDYLGAPRSTNNDSKLYQLMTGITGTVDAIDGSWDVYFSTGETQTQSNLENFGDWVSYQALVGSANYGRDAVLLGPITTTPFQGSGGTATCQTGLPIFETFAISEDCKIALAGVAANVLTIDQDIVEGTVQGRIGELWAGEVRFAGGVSYRENSIDYQHAAQNSKFSPVTALIGLQPGSSTAGATSAADVFGEVLLPLIAGDGFVQSFDLELGSRYSDYDEQGTSSTYKALFSLGLEAPVRFRGGLQHANRAPNVGELYSPENNVSAGSRYNGDPCASNSTAPWGANPTYNTAPGGVDRTKAICSELMGPTGAAAFYSTIQTGLYPTVPIVERGNPTVQPETADTVTFGAVITLDNIELGIDWYKIEIEDVIGQIGYDALGEQCLSPQYNTSGTVSGSSYCGYIIRNQTDGTSLRTEVPRANLGHYETSGVDVQFNWRKQLGEGMLGLNVLSSFLSTYELQETPDSAVIDIVGTNGATGGAQFDYRTFTTLNYSQGPLTTALRWRHYPSIEHTNYRTDPNTATEGAAKYDIFDFSGGYAFNEKYELRFGIDNLLDKDPPIYGRNVNPNGAPGTLNSATGSTLNSVYDVLGRRGYVGFQATF